MTADEKSKTVALLHLAATLADTGQNWPPIICDAEKILGFGAGSILEPGPIALFAYRACAAVNGGCALGYSKDRGETCRDAAIRVAEGTWP